MNIKQIKEKYTCLDYLGDRVVRKVANGYLARCPWREDRHPSLTITENGKGWHDHTTGKHGNLIDLVMRCLDTNDLSRVCAEFDVLQPNISSFHQSKNFDKGKEKVNAFAFFEVRPLLSRGLYAYLAQRKVNINIAKQFLKEAHYSFQKRTDGSYLYALAYGNDLGGYELRSAPYTGNPNGFKGGTAPKGITTHILRENAATVVFEGFMDLLSWVTMTEGVKHNLVVMNSVVNKEATVEVLRSLSGKIYLCLDNDKGGNDATAFIQNAVPPAIDYRSHFAGYKDVNEYLCHRSR